MNMIINYIGDLNINAKNKNLKKIINSTLPEKGDFKNETLIILGNVSKNFNQTYNILKIYSYYFKDIFYVTDDKNISRLSILKNKIQLEKLENNFKNVHVISSFTNNKIYNVNGFLISGLSMYNVLEKQSKFNFKNLTKNKFLKYERLTYRYLKDKKIDVFLSAFPIICTETFKYSDFNSFNKKYQIPYFIAPVNFFANSNETSLYYIKGFKFLSNSSSDDVKKIERVKLSKIKNHDSESEYKIIIKEIFN